MYKIAVLVSGSGSNLQAIIDSINNGELNCTIGAVISDKEDAYGIKRAKNNNIPTYIFNKKQYGDKLSTEILKVVEGKVDLIVLAGFLSILKGDILNIFKNKIINIHPSLLPLFCGSNMYGIKVHEKALESGTKVSGCTVHYVEAGIDTGNIILQKTVAVYSDDTPETLQKRVLTQEHKALPEVIRMKINESEARIMKKRALISVYDKTNILELAEFLIKKEFEIISTGGTYKFLKENHMPVTEVSEVTSFEEILDGRVKTLHPTILGGILAIRDNKEHMSVIKNKGIVTIDMVVVNLYPFFDKVQEDLSFEDKVEFIDIGGPTMIRAGAKNFQDVVVLTDVQDYKKIIMEIEEDGDVSYITRKKLAGKVFNIMSAYDGAIANFLLGTDEYEEYLTVSYKKNMDLRYGENPHQNAAYYVASDREGAMKDLLQLNGKELSYNNIKDMDIAWKVVSEFEETICCAVKHNTPCGAAIGENLLEAYTKTYECDPMSIFGGVVAFNKKVDKATAMELVKIFLEIVIAPGFDEEALQILSGKKNLRVIEAHITPRDKREIVSVDGGILVQSRDISLIENLNVVTEKAPRKEDMADMIFAMKIVKYVKSNAIVVVKDGMAKGIGGGQVNRIWSTIEALGRAKDGVILASDAFFPFKDVVEKAAEYNIRGIIQPGGSINDGKSIESCNELGIPMVFTGIRHFKH